MSMKTLSSLVAFAAASVLLAGCGAKPVDPTATTAYKNLSAQLDQTKSQLANAQATVAQDEKQLANLHELMKEASSEHAKAATQLSQSKAANAQAQALLRKMRREQGLIVRNTVTNGAYWVGHDMRPGTYRSTGNSECYWQISSDANGQNIIANNNVTGPAIVSVSGGQYFQSDRCSKWVPVP